MRGRLDKHLLPRFGSERLDRIGVAAIEKLRDDLRAEDYSHLTINTILNVVSSVFEAAIRRNECAINPVGRVERARKAARELAAPGEDEAVVDPHDVLDPSEIALLLDEAEPGYRTLFATAFVTGMRSGELLGLPWGDVQFDENGRGRIFVRRSLSRARVGRNEPVRVRFYPPKTKAGVREVTISPDLVRALKVWRLACPKGELNLVFPHVDGGPNDRDRILRYGLRPALRRAKLREVNFHSLRHSCASAMIAAGSVITEVQHRLGHATPAVTLRVYSHFLKGVESNTADKAG